MATDVGMDRGAGLRLVTAAAASDHAADGDARQVREIDDVNVRTVYLALLCLSPVAAGAAEPAGVQAAPTRQVTTATQSVGVVLTDEERLAARIWGLTPEEMQRASVLLKGPRAAFSIPNLSPVEALGIHARTPAERRRYAEMFARAQHDDIERVIAFANEYGDAMRRLYGVEPVVDHAGAARLPATPAQAQAAHLPRGTWVPAAPAPQR